MAVQIDPKYAAAYYNMGKNNRIKNKYYKNVKVDASFVEKNNFVRSEEKS